MYETLRRWLIKRRREAELTQVELSKKLRRPQSYVSKVEIGERRVNVIEFVRICRVLKADPGEIISKLTR